MKVSELRELLNHLKSINPLCDDNEVVIPVMGHDIGGTSCISVKNAFNGIDWDKAKFFIYPEKELIVKT